MNLLAKTRRITQKVKQMKGIDYVELLQMGSDLTRSNSYLIHPDGEIVNATVLDEEVTDCIQAYLSQGMVSSKLLGDLRVTHTITNVNIKEFPNDSIMVVPILCGGDLLGLLVFVRKIIFTDEDILVGELVGTVLGIEFQHTRCMLTQQEEKSRKDASLAVQSLSYSELIAAEQIFHALDGMQGLVVASKVADKFGMTRSVIVNALRKLESAGIVESRSLGMRGTYIKIHNQHLLSTLEKVCSQKNNMLLSHSSK